MSATTTNPPKEKVRRGGRGRQRIYGEPIVRRSVDIPVSLYTLLERHVAEENFKAGRSTTTMSRVIVDRLYDFFGLKNPINE